MRYPLNRNRRSNLAIGFVVLLVLVQGAVLASAQASDMDDILRDWRDRQASYARVKYILHSQVLVPKGVWTGGVDTKPPGAEFPEKDYTYDESTTLSIDFAKNMIRKEHQSRQLNCDLARYVPFFAVEVFDGNEMTRYTPRSRNTTPEYTPPAIQPDVWVKGDPGFLLQPPHYPILFGHGAIFEGSPDARPIRGQLNKLRFRIAGHAATDDGRDCLVLRSPASKDRRGGFDELWIDPSRASAVVKWSQYMNGRIFTQCDVTYETSAQVWLPKSWRMSQWSTERDDFLYGSTTTRVKERYLNPALSMEDFVIKPSPGEIVHVKDLDLRRVGNDGTTMTSIPLGHAPGRSSPTVASIAILALGAAIALALAAIAIQLYRTNRQRRLNV